MQCTSLQTQKPFAKLLVQITSCATSLKQGDIDMLLLMHHCPLPDYLFSWEKKFENNFIIGMMLHNHFAHILKTARATPAAILNDTSQNQVARLALTVGYTEYHHNRP